MRTLILTLAMALAMPLMAQKMTTLQIDRFSIKGPYELKTPYMVDEVDTRGMRYDEKSLLDTPVDTSGLFSSEEKDGTLSTSYGHAMAIAGFRFENTSYLEGKLNISGIDSYKMTIDGETATDRLCLVPGTHEVIIRYVISKGETISLKASLETTKGEARLCTGKRMYTIHDVLHATKLGRLSLSADGRYLLAGFTRTAKGGQSEQMQRLYDIKSSTSAAFSGRVLGWRPQGHEYYMTDNSTLIRTDAETGEQTKIAALPKGMYCSMISNDESTIILSGETEGMKSDKEVYEIISPDDRQPGWRDRSYIAMLNTETGVSETLTYGYSNARALSLSKDGRQLLFMSSRNRYGRRPTTLMSIYLMDLETREVRTIVKDDGFIGSAVLSPDGKKVLISGSPECLGSIGSKVRKDQTPSMVDTQLYMYDIATSKLTPLTRDFNPNVTTFVWNEKDNMIYLTAENKDEVSLFRLNPSNGKISQVKVPEEMVNSFTMAGDAPVLAFAGNSACNSDRLYVMDTEKDNSTLLWDVNQKALDNVALAECKPWTFKNSRGDMIVGRYYLPADFDPSRKYPMIVNYYGGCSPTSRTFESRYPHHAYAALGYVVYIVEPSGATGFGQEFSARHVNTAGEGPAQDIIEGVQQFCKEHSFVDASKIGCIGASYGGFMTMYLQTKTDLFAAAISHAGISDHTSYWGEGYWGFSYSEVSMANEYPWSNHELYVNRSPLFQAEKIQTPILFLHGSKDNNVPVGESIQMYNALRLLERETAFVEVADQDHHILDYSKRIKWQMTIFAWFQKYLKNDSSWWDTMYPHFEN